MLKQSRTAPLNAITAHPRLLPVPEAETALSSGSSLRVPKKYFLLGHAQIAERSDCRLENLPPSFWLDTSFVTALRICVHGVGLAGANFMAVAVSRLLKAQPELRAPELANLNAHLREFFLYNR